jgi:hypothetical protein
VGRDEEKSGQQRARRIPYQVNVVMRPRTDVELLKGEVCNLSSGGMFIKTAFPLKEGTIFDVEVPMQPLNYIGPVKVLWTRDHDGGPDKPCGMAVEWINLSISQKKLLYRQIDDHVRNGGILLVGNPVPRAEARPSSGAPQSPTGAVSDRTALIVGLSIAVAVLLVIVIVLL